MPTESLTKSLVKIGAIFMIAAIIAVPVWGMYLSHGPEINSGYWSSTGDLDTGRTYHTATLLLDGRVLVAGGYGDYGYVINTEVYNPATGTWSPTGNLITGRTNHTATRLLDGRVLVVGGEYGITSAVLYDPTTGQWSPTGSMNTARGGHTATLLLDGTVLVTGGQWLENYVTDTAEIYDPDTGNWSYTGNMNIIRSYHTAVLLNDGHVLVAGGTNGGKTAELYDPETGGWTPIDNMNFARSAPTVTLLPDGRVLVAGDHGSNGDSAELYDPTTGLWSITGNLNTARGLHTATLLPDGRVLAAGGYGRNYYALDSAELYDPTTGLWNTTGNLNYARHDHTATLLQDGRVLVAGGYGNNGYLTSAEIYTSIPKQAPVGLDDSYQTDEDSEMAIAAPGVLSNDTDADGNVLTALPDTSTTHGTLSLNPDGAFLYTPTLNYNGLDSFTYFVSDGTLTDTATVTLTITPINDPPEGVNDSYQMGEGSVLYEVAPGVLGNDTDIDGDALIALLSHAPDHGSLSLNTDGSFIYTPTFNYTGMDNFAYIASDGILTDVVAANIAIITANNKEFIPIITRDYPQVYWETEPNNSYENADGPLNFGIVNYGFSEDQDDYFTFDLNQTSNLIIELFDHTTQDGQLLLYRGATQYGQDTDLPEKDYHFRLICSDLPIGTYYIRVYNNEDFYQDHPYRLTISESVVRSTQQEPNCIAGK